MMFFASQKLYALNIPCICVSHTHAHPPNIAKRTPASTHHAHIYARKKTHATTYQVGVLQRGWDYFVASWFDFRWALSILDPREFIFPLTWRKAAYWSGYLTFVGTIVLTEVCECVRLRTFGNWFACFGICEGHACFSAVST